MVGGLEIVPLLGGEPCIQRQPDHSEHSVHRRPDFVAHVGEKLGFRLPCLFSDPSSYPDASILPNHE